MVTEAVTIEIGGEAGTAVLVTDTLGFEAGVEKDADTSVVEDAKTAVEEWVANGKGTTDTVVAGTALVEVLIDKLDES